MIKTIAVLLTCHNRKEKTLQCLQALYNQKRLEVDYSISVFLVDDGSTDSTATLVKSQYPLVNIIQGNGDLFWNRGMHLAWHIAAATKEYDYYLWLNDDTFLQENAINTLLFNSSSKSIISGTTQSFGDKKATYGGYVKKSGVMIIPNGSFQKCDYFNGNCVLIPREVFCLVGNLDYVFHHAVGDFDYGLRAKKMGVELFVAPEFIGTCESNDFVPKWRSPSETIYNRLKSLYTVSSGCYPPQFFVFDRRHNGLFIACVHFFSIHLRAIVPAFWK